MNNRQLTGSGFTLIELLVVISIVGLLASVVLVSLNNARLKARDTKRRADLKQLQTGLELYAAANDGSYPSSGGSTSWRGNCSNWGSYGATGPNAWIPNLSPVYVSTLPLDPKSSSFQSCYLYTSDGVDYKLLAHMTTESVCPVPPSDPMYDAVRAGQCTFGVYTTGAANW